MTQVFSGLDAEQGYRFQFRATNSVGDSSYSPSANATTDAAPITLTAPAFADDTGDDQAWTQNTAIASITVPAASGNPTPTYASSGRPPGLSFSTASRIISGTPTTTGSGTITVTATNSEGSDTWTVDYVTAAAPTTDVAPSFTDDTGDAQSWVQNTAITSVTVPAASGTPTPTYAVVGTLPAGLAFNTTTRVISGTPTAVGSGTITIRATNSEGDDDWTVSYTTTATATAPRHTCRPDADS